MSFWKTVLTHGVLRTSPIVLIGPFLAFFLMDLYHYVQCRQSKYFDSKCILFDWSYFVISNLYSSVIISLVAGFLVGCIIYFFSSKISVATNQRLK